MTGDGTADHGVKDASGNTDRFPRRAQEGELSRARGGRVLGHGAIYTIGTMAQSGLAVLLLPIATRVLGVEQYGLVGTAVAIGGVLGLIYGLGLNFAIARLYYDDEPASERAGWAALVRVQAIVALALACLTYSTGHWWSALITNLGWVWAFKLAVVMAWLTAMQATVQGLLRAAQRPLASIAVTAIQVVIGGALGLGLAVRWGAAGYVGGLAIGSATAVVAGVALTYRRPRWSRTVVAGGLALSLPALLHQLAGWGIDAADRLLVAAYLGVEGVARYQVAYVLGTSLTMVLIAVQAAWSPFYIGSLSSRARRIVPSRLVVPVSATTAIAVALLVLAAPYLTVILAPAGFRGNGLVTSLVASAATAKAAYFVAVVVILDRRKTGQLAVASLAGAVLNVALNVGLIPLWGLKGAGLATLLAVVIQAFIVLAIAQRLLEERMHLARLAALWLGSALVTVALTTVRDGLTRLALLPVLLLAGVMSLKWLRSSFAVGAHDAASGSAEEQRASGGVRTPQAHNTDCAGPGSRRSLAGEVSA